MLKWQPVCNRQLSYVRRFFYNRPRCLRHHKQKHKVVRIEIELFFLSFFFFFFFLLAWAGAPNVYVRAWALCCLHSRISTQTFRRALTASGDSCAEIRSASIFTGTGSLLAEFGGRYRKAKCSERGSRIPQSWDWTPREATSTFTQLLSSESQPNKTDFLYTKKKLFSIFHCCVLD